MVKHFRHEYDGGKRLAVLQCLVFCREQEIAVPESVLAALTGWFKVYLTNSLIDFEDAIIGTRRGPHANGRSEHNRYA